MQLRLSMCFLSLCGLASAEQSAWDRFFTQPPVSAQQGMDRAMSNAVANTFDRRPKLEQMPPWK